jgi:hypothetical protein
MGLADYLELLKWGAIASVVNVVLLLILLADRFRHDRPAEQARQWERDHNRGGPPA